MARAIPTFLEAFPMDDAAAMGADCASLGDRAILEAIDRMLSEPAPQDRVREDEEIIKDFQKSTSSQIDADDD